MGSSLRKSKALGIFAALLGFLFALFVGLTPVTAAEPAPILAVFDIEDRGAGLSEETLSRLTDYLVVLLTSGGYEVVPRQQIKERISLQKEEGYKACYDQSCQVELGRELAAQKSLATQVIQVGGVCRLTGAMIDLKKATTEKASFVRSACGEKELFVALEELAEKLTGRKMVEPTKPEIATIDFRRKKATEAEAARNRRKEAQEAELAGKRRKKAQEEQAEKKRMKDALAGEQQTGEDPGPTVGIYDLTMSIHSCLVFPNLGETLSVDLVDGGKGEVKMGFGYAIDTQIDVQMNGPPYPMYMGAFVLYYHAEDLEDSDVVKYLAMGLAIRMHFDLLSSLELRFNTEMGFGFHLGTEITLHLGESNSLKVFDSEMDGLFCKPSLELVWYPIASLGLVLEFGTMFEMVSGTSDLLLPPLLFFSLGLEGGI